jgi:uncharacterized protein YpmB
MSQETKHFIIILILGLIFSTIGVCAQSTVTRVGNTFKVEQTSSNTSNDTKTKYTYQDSKGNEYPIYITKNNSVYVIKVSKNTGKEYKYYLPKNIKEQILKEIQ